MTQIPWSEGKCAASDVTVTDTLAASNVSSSISASGSAAEAAASKKLQKYSELMSSYNFVPVAFETLGSVNTAGTGTEFIDEIGKRSHAISSDRRQRFSCGSG